MICYLQPCLTWTETLHLFSAFRWKDLLLHPFTAFQMEISFDGGSFQNLIQKSLSSDAPTDVSRTMCSRQRHNVVMIPMPQTTW